MIKRSWVQTPPHIMDGCGLLLAITYTKIMKIKIAKWGTPKKYLKKV
jgi:hypothetical protein